MKMENNKELNLNALSMASGGEIEAFEYPIIDYYIQDCKKKGWSLATSIYTVDSEEMREYIRKRWDTIGSD